MEYKDYYKIMGVSRDAGQDEIKRAYRKLARKYHPDVSKEVNAEKKFKEVGEAYEVLKDPEKRAAYDRIGSHWKHGEGFTPPPGWDAGFKFSGGGFTGGDTSGFSDFFESLFGRGFRISPDEGVFSREFHLHGEDQYARIMIDLEDAYRGVTRSISLKIPQTDEHGQVISKQRTLRVKIPKGVKEGQRIRLSGQGQPVYGKGKSGDLYLEVIFKKHPIFRAEGKDIFVQLPVSPWEAALGGSVPVPTLGGEVEFKIPAGSQSGRKFRLKGRGLPGTPPGDQYVELKIMTPAPATEEDRALYEKMAKAMPMNPRAGMGV
ncbi:MAG: DnaJ C-terminal domain-containing protein [Gammaproteobacteria bacterium]